jgi:hypothetical protein
MEQGPNAAPFVGQQIPVKNLSDLLSPGQLVQLQQALEILVHSGFGSLSIEVKRGKVQRMLITQSFACLEEQEGITWIPSPACKPDRNDV